MRKRGALLSIILCITMITSCVSVCFAEDSIIEAAIESGIELLVDEGDVYESQSKSINEADAETEGGESPTDSDCNDEVDSDSETSMVEESKIEDDSDTSENDSQNLKPEQSVPEQSVPEQSVPEQSEPEQNEPEQSEPEQSEPEQSEPEQNEPEQSVPEQNEPEQNEPEQSVPDMEVEEKIDEELDVELLLMSTSVAGTVYTLRDQIYGYEVRDYVYSSRLMADIVGGWKGDYVVVDIIIRDTETNYISFDLCYESDFIILEDCEFGDVPFDNAEVDMYDGVITYTATSDYNTYADGVLLTLWFYVPEECPTGVFELFFDSPVVRNRYYGTIDMYVFNGCIDVIPSDYFQVSAPVASVASGTVPQGTRVRLSSATEGATIYYTTNGRTPTTSSTRYTGSIVINSNTVIKAIAVKNGLDDSEISVFRYTVSGDISSGGITRGDANGDGNIDFVDALLVLKHDAGTASLSGDNLTAADTNNDEEVDFVDALLILKYDAGLITEFN